LNQSKSTILSILEERYSVGDETYIQYSNKVNEIYTQSNDYLMENFDYLKKIKKYNEKYEYDNREMDHAKGDDSKMNRIISEENERKAMNRVVENYKAVWETIISLNELSFDIYKKESKYKRYCYEDLELIQLQIDNFKKSF